MPDDNNILLRFSSEAGNAICRICRSPKVGFAVFGGWCFLGCFLVRLIFLENGRQKTRSAAAKGLCSRHRPGIGCHAGEEAEGGYGGALPLQRQETEEEWLQHLGAFSGACPGLSPTRSAGRSLASPPEFPDFLLVFLGRPC